MKSSVIVREYRKFKRSGRMEVWWGLKSFVREYNDLLITKTSEFPYMYFPKETKGILKKVKLLQPIYLSSIARKRYV